MAIQFFFELFIENLKFYLFFCNLFVLLSISWVIKKRMVNQPFLWPINLFYKVNPLGFARFFLFGENFEL